MKCTVCNGNLQPYPEESGLGENAFKCEKEDCGAVFRLVLVHR